MKNTATVSIREVSTAAELYLEPLFVSLGSERVPGSIELGKHRLIRMVKRL